MKLVVGILIFLVSLNATAKTKIDIPIFGDESAGLKCSAGSAWQGQGMPVALQQQLINRLSESGQFNIVESERMRSEKHESGSAVRTIHKSNTFKASQYTIVGAVKSFEHCNHRARVIVEVKVIDVASGSVTETFVSKAEMRSRSNNLEPDVKGAPFNSGLFKDSALGKATMSVMADAAEKLKRAFPEREVATAGYKVRTYHKSRRGR